MLLCRERYSWWCAVDVGLPVVLSWFTSVCHAQLLSDLGRCIIVSCTVCLHAVLQTVAVSAHGNYRQATQGWSCRDIWSVDQSVKMFMVVYPFPVTETGLIVCQYTVRHMQLQLAGCHSNSWAACFHLQEWHEILELIWPRLLSVVMIVIIWRWSQMMHGTGKLSNQFRLQGWYAGRVYERT